MRLPSTKTFLSGMESDGYYQAKYGLWGIAWMETA
jgi:hypothetical protein